MLPVLVIPIMFALSWVFFPVQAETRMQSMGLNTSLPVPQLKTEKQSKAAAYEFQEQADKEPDNWELPALYRRIDSDQELEGLVNDAEESYAIKEVEQSGLGIPSKFLRTEKESSGKKVSLDQQEEQIEKQLQSLDALLANQGKQSVESNSQKQEFGAGSALSIESRLNQEQTSELELMKQMMDELESSAQQPDAQLEQLSAIMDKLLLLQNPELGERIIEPAIELEKRAFPALKENGLGVSELRYGIEGTEELNHKMELEEPNGFLV